MQYLYSSWLFLSSNFLALRSVHESQSVNGYAPHKTEDYARVRDGATERERLQTTAPGAMA